MTALNEYERLEATGLWRARPDDQRREVIVAMGDATLTITDLQDRVLTHWSLAAVMRANKGERPAVYHPDGDPGETLELAENETEMIAAIERLRTVIDRRRPHPGRLRQWITLGVAGAAALGLALWLPDAMVAHAQRVVPDVKRAELSRALLTELTRVSGAACRAQAAQPALATLAMQLTGEDTGIVVLPGGIVNTAHLPDGTILMNRTLIEDYETPDVPAGFAVAEKARLAETEPLAEFLRQAGLWASLRFLTTGRMPEEALKRYTEWLLTAPSRPVAKAALLKAFAEAKLSIRPYAYALDITGESTLELIEADPMAGQSPAPVIRDADWVRLQGICGS